MPKHTIGTAVGHSRYGQGRITGVHIESQPLPEPFDPVSVRRRQLALQAQVASLQREADQLGALLERNGRPLEADVYTVTFDNGRVISIAEGGVDKLIERAALAEPAPEAREVG